MQLIIKDGKILATHEDNQDVADKYPDCECVAWAKELPPEELNEFGLPGEPLDDPRSAEEKKEAYLDKRRVSYPSIESQLDMIYHDTIDGTTTWQDAITAVKTAYPKASLNSKISKE